MRYTKPVIEFTERCPNDTLADLTSQTDNGFIDTNPDNFGPVIKLSSKIFRRFINAYKEKTTFTISGTRNGLNLRVLGCFRR